jgi:transposase-like protein
MQPDARLSEVARRNGIAERVLFRTSPRHRCDQRPSHSRDRKAALTEVPTALRLCGRGKKLASTALAKIIITRRLNGATAERQAAMEVFMLVGRGREMLHRLTIFPAGKNIAAL